LNAQTVDLERATPASTADRWFALDVFRALAVLWMIQGQLLVIGTILQFPRASWREIFTERELAAATINRGALQLVAAGLR
jgi:hypothetical protein